MARRSTPSKTPSPMVSGTLETDPFRPTIPDAPQARARLSAEVQESPLLTAIASVPPPAVQVVTAPAAQPSTSEPFAGEISGQFFAQELDSVPPGIELPLTEEPERAPVPPHVVARRKRARSLVTAAVAVLGAFALLAAGKALMTRASRGDAMAAYTAQAETRAETAVVTRNVVQLAEAVPAAKPEMPQAEPALPAVPDKQAEPALPAVPDKQAEPALPAEPEKQAEPEAPAVDAAKLRKDAESLANRGRYADAIAASRAAIEADATHALPYLLLGTSLQMTGKWKDGVEAYCECVRNATKGPVHECRAAGGHK